MALETQLQSKIIKHLSAMGYAVKTILTNQNGTPDILACLNGTFVAIECKAPGKKPTRLQEFNLRKIRKAGGKAECFDNFEDYKNWIENLNHL